MAQTLLPEFPKIDFASSSVTYRIDVVEGVPPHNPAQSAHVVLAEIAKDVYGLIICNTLPECKLVAHPPKAVISYVIDEGLVLVCNERARTAILGRADRPTSGPFVWTRIDLAFTSTLDFLWFVKVFAEAKSDVTYRSLELRSSLQRVMRTVPRHSPPSRPERLCTIASHRPPPANTASGNVATGSSTSSERTSFSTANEQEQSEQEQEQEEA